MSSERQIDANRANGAKSHGPVTPEGKAICSQNGIRHGLLAKTILLDDESRTRFGLLVETLRREYQPRNETEFGLVDTLAVTRWRQMRVWALETSAVNQRIRTMAENNEQIVQKDEADGGDSTARAANAYRQLCDDSNFLELMARYETRFDRQFNRTLDRLMRLRAKNDFATQTQLDE
jgi:hypothetical protein